MKFIYNKIFLEHNTGMHPENKKRLECLGNITETIIKDGEQYLELIHTKEHINQVKKACESQIPLDPDTITSKKSFQAATQAVGATIMASKTNDFALVRPPGHHSYIDHSSGFCLFNNIAIASQKLVNQGKKVLIFDFDGHCGDGTMNTFYNTNNVLYLSLHQSPAYPGFGNVNEIGEGTGKGYTINIPLPPSTGDDLYMKAIDTFIPIAKQFNPDFVAVSAGFDAHHLDPLLSLRLTYNTYYDIGKILKNNFKNIFATLEGGYNTQILPSCIYSFVDGINENSQKFKEKGTDSSDEITSEFEQRISHLKRYLSNYWKF